MHRDHQVWYSHRLNRHMGIAIYGNYGAPILAFPTSCGDEWEMEGQGMIPTLSPYLEQGRIRIFCINSVQQRFIPKQGSASLSSELDAGAVRCLCGERGFPVHRLTVPNTRHRDRHTGRIARCISRGQHSLQTSRPREALLRALRRLRHAGFHGRDVRRQLLLQ